MTVTKTETKSNFGHYDVPPEKAVENYAESKNFNSVLRVYETQTCSQDMPSTSLELAHIHVETICHEAQQLLTSLIESTPQNKENNSKKTEQCTEVLKELRNNFARTNDFIRLNDQKFKIAERAIQSELRVQEKLSEEIGKLQQEIETFEGFLGRLESEVDKLEPYESVINDVVRDSDLFISVQDCMERRDGLMRAQDEIRDLQKEILNEAKEVQAAHSKAVNEVSSTDLGLRNEMTDMEALYLAALSQAGTWEDILGKINDVFVDIELNTCKVEDALKSMCIILMKRQKVSAMDFENFLPVEMLEYIAKEVNILEEVLKRCQREKKSKGSSNFSKGSRKLSP